MDGQRLHDDADAASTWFDELHDAATSDLARRANALPGADFCRSGAVLRALLFVHGVLAVGLAVVSRDVPGWVSSLATAATLAVPATLAWLLGACFAGRGGERFSGRMGWGSSGHVGGRLSGNPRVNGATAANSVLGHGLAAAWGAAVAWLSWWPLQWLALAPQPATAALPPMLCGATLALAFFHWMTLRRKAQVPAAAVAHLAELQSRVRPHFLFNTLNTAITLVRIDPGRAEEVLEDLADLFRAALSATDEVSTLGQEIALARRYLAIEALRFDARLRVEWDLDPTADAARLPPLVLQPLVENAVRHGVEPAVDGGWVRIRTHRRGDRVHITVSNTVPAGPSRPGHGIGLSSVRERLRLLHDLDAEFQAGPTGQGGFQVRLGLPSQ